MSGFHTVGGGRGILSVCLTKQQQLIKLSIRTEILPKWAISQNNFFQMEKNYGVKVTGESTTHQEVLEELKS